MLLVSARLMAAYNIPNNSSSSASDSVLCLRPVWKHVPEEGRLSFGRILRVFTEGAIVTLRDGKTRYIVPEIHSSNRQMNSQTTAVYSVNCFRSFFGVHLRCSYDFLCSSCNINRKTCRGQQCLIRNEPFGLSGYLCRVQEVQSKCHPVAPNDSPRARVCARRSKRH